MNRLRWTRTDIDIYLEFSVDGGRTWAHYRQSQFCQPEVDPWASKGYRTMQKLLKMGYQF